MEGLMEDATKIRKRGCSPSSSTSSVIQNYRFKRAILVGKRGGGGGGGGSTTPVPTWRMVGSRSPSVVLRAAAAAAASPRYPPSLSGKSRAGEGQPPVSARKLAAALWEMNEVSSPRVVEEDFRERRVGRREKVRRSLNSGCSLPPHLSDPSHSPVSERVEISGTSSHRRRESSISRRPKIDHFDSVSNASFMEIETRSRCQTPSGSTVGVRTRLKDVSNALTTSKELLKIITRMLGHENQPSSSLSLISALHSELERARLQINQLIQEDHSDHKEINHLLKRFAEEKAAWKNKEQEMVESIEVERKLRGRFESLNKKLGKELAETKASFLKVVKELKIEKGESLRIQEEVEKGKLEAFLSSSNGSKENGHVPVYRRRDADLARRDIDETTDDGENSTDSDLHSIELNTARNSNRVTVDELKKGRKSIANQVARRSISLLRSVSDVVQWGNNGLSSEIDKQVPRRSCGDEIQRYNKSSGRALQEHTTLPSSRLGLDREIPTPSGQRGPPWPSRDPCNVGLHRPMRVEGSGTRVRLEEDGVEGQNSRRSRR